MTYPSPPTPDDFRTRYPEFAALDDATIQRYLDDAARSVDQTWLAGDYQNAIMSLAAHYYSTGSAATQGGGSDPASGYITSEHIGQVSISYAVPGGVSNMTWLTSTPYGQSYARLLKLNFPGALAVSAIVVPAPWH